MAGGGIERGWCCCCSWSLEVATAMGGHGGPSTMEDHMVVVTGWWVGVVVTAAG